MTGIREKSNAGRNAALRSMLLALIFVIAPLLGLSFPAEAQQPKKIPTISYLTIGYPPTGLIRMSSSFDPR